MAPRGVLGLVRREEENKPRRRGGRRKKRRRGRRFGRRRGELAIRQKRPRRRERREPTIGLGGEFVGAEKKRTTEPGRPGPGPLLLATCRRRSPLSPPAPTPRRGARSNRRRERVGIDAFAPVRVERSVDRRRRDRRDVLLGRALEPRARVHVTPRDRTPPRAGGEVRVAPRRVAEKKIVREASGRRRRDGRRRPRGDVAQRRARDRAVEAARGARRRREGVHRGPSRRAFDVFGCRTKARVRGAEEASEDVAEADRVVRGGDVEDGKRGGASRRSSPPAFATRVRVPRRGLQIALELARGGHDVRREDVSKVSVSFRRRRRPSGADDDVEFVFAAALEGDARVRVAQGSVQPPRGVHREGERGAGNAAFGEARRAASSSAAKARSGRWCARGSVEVRARARICASRLPRDESRTTKPFGTCPRRRGPSRARRARRRPGRCCTGRSGLASGGGGGRRGGVRRGRRRGLASVDGRQSLVVGT